MVKNTRGNFTNLFWEAVSSSKLALILVIIIILISIAGAVLPQESHFDRTDIEKWQKDHKFITAFLKPAGMFQAFHSILFLVSILLLAINTFTCTLKYFFLKGGLACFKGEHRIKNIGFILMHLSLIGIFAGGGISAGYSMDGFIVLTEGQVFKEIRESYISFAEGPFRKGKHKGFELFMNKVKMHYDREYIVNMEVELLSKTGRNKIAKNLIKINIPFTYENLDFTLDETGFSPKIRIREKKSGKMIINSFMALKTFKYGKIREYRDIIPLKVFKDKIIITLYPKYSKVKDEIKKTGEEPENPILLIEKNSSSGEILSKEYLPLKGKLDIGEYTIEFTDLRRWASFRVVEDPGYTVMFFAIWIGVIAMFFRYFSELRSWGSGSRTLSDEEI